MSDKFKRFIVVHGSQATHFHSYFRRQDYYRMICAALCHPYSVRPAHSAVDPEFDVWNFVGLANGKPYADFFVVMDFHADRDPRLPLEIVKKKIRTASILRFFIG